MMGTTRLEGDKLKSVLLKAVLPFGISKGMAVAGIRGVVRINGREETFDLDALEVTAVPVTIIDQPGVRSEPAGRGKIKLATVNGVTL